MLANVVSNWDKITGSIQKKIVTVMSFNNGGYWTPLNAPHLTGDGKSWACTPNNSTCTLHLHSISTTKNVGRVFSTSSAPGIIMGVGSVGDSLSPYYDCDTFLSSDAGQTWTSVQKGPYKYEIIDGGSTLVIIPDGKTASNSIMYSKDRGKTWLSMVFSVDGKSWMPLFTVIDPKSISQKVLLGVATAALAGTRFVVSLDFSKLYPTQCVFDPNNGSKEDFELFHPSSGVSSVCLMGESVGYYRRKADANCFLGSVMDNLKNPVSTPCECTDLDFECDIDYSKVSLSSKCIQVGLPKDQPFDCLLGSNYTGFSGYRKIPGNHCMGGNDKLADPISKPCQNGTSNHVPPPSGSAATVNSTVIQPKVSQILFLKHTKIVFIVTRDGSLYRSPDEGASWSVVTEAVGYPILKMQTHNTVTDRVFFFTSDKIFVSENALETKWSEMQVPERYNSFGLPVFDFHPTQKDWYVYIAGGKGCPSTDCYTKTFITKDAGKTFIQIDSWTNKCIWARDKNFRDPTINEDSVFCASFQYKDGKTSQDKLRHSKDNPVQLAIISKEGKERHVVLDFDIADFFVVDKILMAAAVEGTLNNITLFTSTDGHKFVTPKFPPSHVIKSKAFTLLPSETGGVFLDVVQNDYLNREYGLIFYNRRMLYKSNEDGDFFSRVLSNSNRGANAKVDLEHIPGIRGLLVANIVSNSRLVSQGSPKRIESLISFDDTSSWRAIAAPLTDSLGNPITCIGTSSCFLHLHSFSDNSMNNYFRNVSAGMMLAVGNVGDRLLDFKMGDIFGTLDGGRTWREIAKGSHKWTIANFGGIIVLADDATPMTSVTYSWDFGNHWASLNVSNTPLLLQNLYTNPDSSSLSVILVGHTISSGDIESSTIVQINFAPILNRICKDEDFTEWTPTHNVDNGSSCFFGEVVHVTKRKQDSICAIPSDFQHYLPSREICECTETDFECDFNFYRNDAGKCILFGEDPALSGQCKKGDTYKGASGFRKLSLSKCVGGLDLSIPIDRICGESVGPINSKNFTFSASPRDFFFFESTSNILLVNNDGKLFKSLNAGLNWDPILNDYSFDQIFQDPFFKTRAFLVSKEKKLGFSNDAGSTFKWINIPIATDFKLISSPLSTHPDHPDWLLWTGVICESELCRSESFVSWDNGNTWRKFKSYASFCRWGSDTSFKSIYPSTVFCSVYKPAFGDIRVLFSQELQRAVLQPLITDATDFITLFEITGFAIQDAYMIAANPSDANILLQVSLNGNDWNKATLPPNVTARGGFTVLPSSSGCIFMHVMEDIVYGSEFGSLIKSCDNGATFQEILPRLNQNRKGYVDFEKVSRLNGTMIANTLSSHQDKKLISQMSYDDGITWNYLKAPQVDSRLRVYDCGNACFLHLHAFTQRLDVRDEFSSPGSAGLMIGIGNVGPHLLGISEGDTFISRDAGRIWSEVAKEAHMHEIGNHGGIIILANIEGAVDSVKYSIDGGINFKELKLQLAMNVTNIVTEPSGTTSSFILLGNTETFTGISISLDFSKFYSRKCTPEDYEIWTADNTTTTCNFGETVFLS